MENKKLNDRPARLRTPLLRTALLCASLFFAGQAMAQPCEGWGNIGAQGFSAGGTQGVSMAIDGNGTPYVTYRDLANSNKATVMKYDGSNWVTVGTAGFSSGAADNPHIAIDGNNVPYVVFKLTSTDKASVMKYNGSSWVLVGSANFSAGTIGFHEIAIDTGGTPYVTFRDDANSDKATVMKYNGSSWAVLGSAGFSVSNIGGTTIAIHGATPYVAYKELSNNDKPTVKKYNGSSWVTVGTAAFSSGVINDLSFAVDNSGTPYVCYGDGTLSNKMTVKKNNGSSWVTVGTAGFSSSAVTNAAITTYGSTPYVAYSDGSYSGKVIVKKYNGSSWVTVDAAGFSAGDVSSLNIKMNSSGVPYVAYKDIATSNKATVMALQETQISGNTLLCIGGATTLSSNVPGGTWSSTNTSSITIGSTTGIATGVASMGPVYAVYTRNGCATYMSMGVDSPPPAITGTGHTCVGGDVWLENTSYGTFSSTSSHVSASSTPGYYGQVNGLSAGTAVVTFSTGACYVTTVVTVVAAPGTFTGNEVTCRNGGTITLGNSVAGGTWSVSGGTATAASVNSSTGVLTPGSVAGEAYVYYKTSLSSPHCMINTSVTVNSTPAIYVFGSLAACANAASGAVLAPNDGYWVGTWSSSNTAVATVVTYGPGYDKMIVPAGAGTATISYQNGPGAACVATKVTTINAAPSAIGGTKFCYVGGTTTLTSTPSGGTWSTSDVYTATVNSSTGVVTGTWYPYGPDGPTSTCTITYTLPTGCYTTTTVTVGLTAPRGAGNSMEQQEEQTTITLMPNPNNGTFTINSAWANTEQVDMTVTDVVGKVVYTGSTAITNGMLNKEIQLQDVPANGMYLLSLRAGNRTEVIRFVIDK